MAVRKSRSLSSLSLSPPHSDEISLIHALYLESMNLKAQKDLIMQNQLSQLVDSISGHKSSEMSTINQECSSGSAVDYGALETPHLFRAKFKWMKNTIFKNVEIMFPQVIYNFNPIIKCMCCSKLSFLPSQDRNMHGKIFGGYIMRKAYELAWVSAVSPPLLDLLIYRIFDSP